MELVQHKATNIILNDYTSTYEKRLELCKLESLQTRWQKQFVKFAKSAVQSERLQNLFQPNDPPHHMSLRKDLILKVPFCRTERLRRSAVMSIIRVINEGNNFKIEYND